MLRTRTKAQNSKAVGRPVVQQTEFRAVVAHGMHLGTDKFVETAIVEAVLARDRPGMSESGGCTAGTWFRIG